MLHYPICPAFSQQGSLWLHSGITWRIQEKQKRVRQYGGEGQIIPSMKIPRTSSTPAALLAGLTLLLAGCASNIPVEECKEVDWQESGRNDGARGIAPRPPTEHAAACSKVGVTLDISPYQKGWEDGIEGFCNARSGWREGVLGNLRKADVCKGKSGEADFGRYFVLGQENFRINEERRQNGLEIRRLSQLESRAKNPVERNTLREQIRVLEAEQTKLRMKLAQQQTSAPP